MAYSELHTKKGYRLGNYYTLWRSTMNRRDIFIIENGSRKNIARCYTWDEANYIMDALEVYKKIEKEIDAEVSK